MSGPRPEDIVEVEAPESALEPANQKIEDSLFTSESNEATLDLDSHNEGNEKGSDTNTCG